MKARLADVTLGLVMRGRGTPLLFVHGFPLNKAMWQTQVTDLSADFQVIAPDLRGHGQSDAPPGDYSMELFADDLNALLDHLDVPKVVFAGLSMGGYVAFAFYKRHKERVAGLILADTRAEADSPEGKAGREKMRETVLSSGAEKVAGDLAGRMLAPLTVQSNPELLERVRRMMAGTPIHGYAGDLRALANRVDSTALLPTIPCPTLVIVGAQDVVTPPADAARMAAAIPKAKLVTIADAGHLSPMEQPAAFNKAVRDFASSL